MLTLRPISRNCRYDEFSVALGYALADLGQSTGAKGGNPAAKPVQAKGKKADKKKDKKPAKKEEDDDDFDVFGDDDDDDEEEGESRAEMLERLKRDANER